MLAFEINEDLISEPNKVTFNDISQYPAVYKDITLITSIDDSLSTVIKEMNNNGYKYMKSIRIKDIFISKDKNNIPVIPKINEIIIDILIFS